MNGLGYPEKRSPGHAERPVPPSRPSRAHFPCPGTACPPVISSIGLDSADTYLAQFAVSAGGLAFRSSQAGASDPSLPWATAPCKCLVDGTVFWGPQRPGAEKTSGEEAKDTAVPPGCLQPSHTTPSPSAHGAEPERQGFLPAGVLRPGMGTEDHSWEVIALRALPDPSLQLCPLCPLKGLSILNLTCPGPTPLQLQTQKMHFLYPAEPMGHVQTGKKPPKGRHIHPSDLGVGAGSKGKFSFLKALKERDPMNPLGHSSPILSCSPPSLA